MVQNLKYKHFERGWENEKQMDFSKIVTFLSIGKLYVLQGSFKCQLSNVLKLYHLYVQHVLQVNILVHFAVSSLGRFMTFTGKMMSVYNLLEWSTES